MLRSYWTHHISLLSPWSSFYISNCLYSVVSSCFMVGVIPYFTFFIMTVTKFSILSIWLLIYRNILIENRTGFYFRRTRFKSIAFSIEYINGVYLGQLYSLVFSRWVGLIVTSLLSFNSVPYEFGFLYFSIAHLHFITVLFYSLFALNCISFE